GGGSGVCGIALQRNSNKYFDRDRLAVYLCRVEDPLAQSLRDWITDARIWCALDCNMADFAFFIHDSRNDHLALRVFLAQVGGNLRPFTDCGRWSQHLPGN